MKLLKYRLYTLRHTPAFLFVVGFFAALAVYLAYRGWQSTFWVFFDETSHLSNRFTGDYGSRAEFIQWYLNRTLSSLFSTDSFGCWCSLFFSLALFCLGFEDRTINLPIYMGFSRIKILLVDLVIYFGVLLLLLLLRFGLAAGIVYAGAKGAWPPEAMAAALGLRILLSLAMGAVPAFISIFLRGYIASLAVGVTVTYWLHFRADLVASVLPGKSLLTYYPAQMQLDPALWTSTSYIGSQFAAAASSVIIILGVIGLVLMRAKTWQLK